MELYLNIGSDVLIDPRKIIGVFDLDTATVSGVTRRFINEKQKKGRVEYTDTDLPRSFVVVEKGGECEIKLSRISTVGLKMRAENEIKNITE